jgi:hypothetical protein
MIQDLEYLVKLQQIDLRIKEQELAREQYPAAVANLTARIAAAETARDNAATRLQQLTGGIDEFEGQAVKLRDSLSKSQDRLNSIQTNREYDAVHKEIEAQKLMLHTAEGKKRSMEADIEKCKTELEDAEKALEHIKTELQPQIDDLNAKIGAIDSNIASITKEREEVSPHISSPIMRTYDSIRKKRKTGKAVSLVKESKTCEVCSVVLRPQLYNEIRRGANFALCESCGSMLILDEASVPPAPAE